jgi:2-polyprenyl-3-methyl-5-hydroxy-6-metoxy-1,4-benzoquinol methylase
MRAGYYLVGLERHYPFKTAIQRLVSDWEARHNRGDAPKPVAAWEAQYGGHAWDYMMKLDESARYAAIINYMSFLKPGGTVLDVGCGQGVLFERSRPFGWSHYVGIDISAAAISQLNERMQKDGASHQTFIAANGETFQPDAGTFDLIIFNESLYYFNDPAETVQRYAAGLKPGGLIIMSTYLDSRRARAVLKQVKHRFRQVIDETHIQQGLRSPMKSWVCTVIDPVVQADVIAATTVTPT